MAGGYRHIVLGNFATWTLPFWFAWDPLLPYLTATILLVLGVRIAINNASQQTRRLDKIVLFGPVFIGLPMAVFGIEHFLDPQGVSQTIPAWIPGHMFWVYFVGACLVVGGLSSVLHRYAWLSAGSFGVMLLCFEVLMEIFRVVANPHNQIAWAVAIRDFSFSWGALSFTATHTEEWRTQGTHWLITLARVFFGISIILFAVEYVLHPALLPGIPLRQLTPTFIPGHSLLGYLTSVVYVIAAVCFLINKYARLATALIGWFVLFVVIIFCAPIMVQHGSDIGRGLNVPIDTLLLSGCTLCLAASLREKPITQNKSMTTDARNERLNPNEHAKQSVLRRFCTSLCPTACSNDIEV